jgi:hypothetical protein
MDLRRSTSYAMVVGILVFVAGCSAGSSEKKLLDDFFRASRLRDNVTLGNFATATFEPRTDGTVQSFEITSVSPERTTPLPLKQYAKAVADAKDANTTFTTEKRTYQAENLAAINRVLRAQADGKPVAAKDRAVKDAWDKWSADTLKNTKAVSDAQRQLGNARAIAELSLSRPNGAMVDATKFDGEMVSKDIALTATVKDPSGQSSTKNLKAVIQRAHMKDESGKDLLGRWIVTSVTPA